MQSAFIATQFIVRLEIWHFRHLKMKRIFSIRISSKTVKKSWLQQHMILAYQGLKLILPIAYSKKVFAVALFNVEIVFSFLVSNLTWNLEHNFKKIFIFSSDNCNFIVQQRNWLKTSIFRIFAIFLCNKFLRLYNE